MYFWRERSVSLGNGWTAVPQWCKAVLLGCSIVGGGLGAARKNKKLRKREGGREIDGKRDRGGYITYLVAALVGGANGGGADGGGGDGAVVETPAVTHV